MPGTARSGLCLYGQAARGSGTPTHAVASPQRGPEVWEKEDAGQCPPSEMGFSQFATGVGHLLVPVPPPLALDEDVLRLASAWSLWDDRSVLAELTSS